MKIDPYISELLYEHDCVIVPQFGGFVANPKPAKADPVQHKFSPPYKEIGFNRNLINNDGLLANLIAVKEGKSYQHANALISEDVEKKKKLLREEKRLELEKIGTLYYDTAQNIRFEPDLSVNYSLDSFGLSLFHALPLQPLQKEEQSSKPANILQEKIISSEERTRPSLPAEKKKRRIGRYLPYAIASLPVIAYMAWLPLKTDVFSGNQFQYSDLNPFSEKICEVYKPRMKETAAYLPTKENDPVYLLNVPDTVSTVKISFFKEADETPVIVKVHDVPEEKPVEKQLKNSENGIYRFHIIGGCFQYFENAESLVEKLRKRGFNASIIDRHKGLYRVSYHGFTTRKEAVEMLASIKSGQNNSAWLLVK